MAVAAIFSVRFRSEPQHRSPLYGRGRWRLHQRQRGSCEKFPFSYQQLLERWRWPLSFRSGSDLNPNTDRHFTDVGGGGSINANVEVVKNFRLVTNNYWSDGGGRYLFGQVPI